MPTRVLSPPPPSPCAAATPSCTSSKDAARISWLLKITSRLKITALESKKTIPERTEECPKVCAPQQPQHTRPAKGSGRRSGSEPVSQVPLGQLTRSSQEGRASAAAAAAAAAGRAMRPRPPPGQPVLLSLLLLPPLLLATSLEKGRREVPHRHAEWQQLWYSNFEEFQRLTEPSFDNNTVTNITVQLGGTAFLHCRVRNLGERTISWVRRRDWHILTSGMFTYTNDERFQVLHAEGSDDWTLQIKYVQKRDNGTYECQVSTGTGIMSHFVNLHIVVPEAFILGSGEHHVDVGSGISLVCIIEKSPTPPQYVFWYHNDRMINYDNARGGITVDTEPGPKTQSRLTIRDAHDTDSGNYTCSASNTEPASIFVFVSEGDKMAAILRRKTSSGSGLDVVLWFVLLPLLVMAAR